MLELALTTVYFFLPAYLANMAPLIFKWLPICNRPLSARLFGSHKTYRGFLVGYLAALITLFVQAHFTTSYDLLQYANFASAKLLLYAFLFGVGALTGDAVKSYFKRRLKIAPGAPFFPFDQLDFVLGTLLFLSPFYIPPAPIILISIIITPIIHFTANVLGYLAGLKKVWW